MTEYEPIVLISSRPEDNRAKNARGRTPDPLVPVTPQLRSSLSGELDTVITTAARLPVGIRAAGLPLTMKLRDRALAKSKRPYKLLGEIEMSPVATGRVGELVSKVTSAGVRRLQSQILGGSRKEDLFAISTFDSFRLWHPIRDAFGLPSADALRDALVALASERETLRLDFFPWMTLDTVMAEGETVGRRLARLGLSPLDYSIGHSERLSCYFEVDRRVNVAPLAEVYGIRSAALAPRYTAYETIGRQAIQIAGPAPSIELEEVLDPGVIVGVLDTGVAAAELGSFVVGQERYDLGSDLDESHGTFVAGLVAAARRLNGDDPRFPLDMARILDAQVIPRGTIDEYMLLDRVRETVRKYARRGIKVWNCSFAALSPLDPVSYSPIAQELDELSRSEGVLFVQSVGNYEGPPRRPWPVPQTFGGGDGLAAPAEAVDSLAVGSVSHRGGCTPLGAPASYSRRGPSFGGQVKPDVCYWSGDVDQQGNVLGFGVKSLQPGQLLAEGAGTSFATPLVSAIAANAWADLEASGAMGGSPDPALVKALVVHKAMLSRSVPAGDHRLYYGAGVPDAPVSVLFDAEHSFTTVHRATLQDRVDWWKDPYPVPACLITPAGKLRAEIWITMAYAPFINPAFGDESVRNCVEVSFGGVSLTDAGGISIKGIVPPAKVEWEAERIENQKWSPVKCHHNRFPQGKEGGGVRWGLKLSMTERVTGEAQAEQVAYVVVTMRSLEEGQPVYQDGLAAIRQLQYGVKPLSLKNRLRVTG